jgi:N-acetyl sugar amidotransferase
MKKKICNRCVMDTTASEIIFYEYGCNYCEEFKNLLNKNKKKKSLESLIASIKKNKKSKYDCIVGLSGGVDSSWVLVKCKEYGLNPLAVHMDNGWNSELAQNNIENLIKDLNVDLYTHVIDWYEYRSLMQSMFDANVLDVEILYDNAMLSVNYNMAKKYNTKYILGGTNLSTEGMRMPKNMNWLKYDKKNIKAIANTFGKIKLNTFPIIGTLDLIYFHFFKRIKWISFLDYFNYEKKFVLETLVKNFNYKPYPYKHYESIFTRFYQGYILPNKFKIDKRILHFSTLIISGQMQREDAIKELNNIPYPSEKVLESDKEYFLKKMNWSNQQLIDYIARPAVNHNFYPSEKKLWDLLIKLYKIF